MVARVSLSYSKLVMKINMKPGVCRHAGTSPSEAGGQILHGLLEVGVLQTHLSQEGQGLALLGKVASLAEDNLSQLKHLPGQLQVANLGVHFLFRSNPLPRLFFLLPLHHLILTLLVTIFARMSSCQHVMRLEIGLKSISHLGFNLGLLVNGHGLSILHRRVFLNLSLGLHVHPVQGIAKNSSLDPAQFQQSSPVVEVGLSALNGSLPLVLDHELTGFGEVGHSIWDGVDQQIALAFDYQLLSMLVAICRYRCHG